MKKILVIDDEIVSVELLKNRLEANHYEVITASDGVEGIVKAQDERPDLIVLDVMMPNLDGYAFVQELKKSEEIRTIPVIIVTARDNLKERFKKEGIEHYIVKPIEMEAFFKKIKGILGE